MRPFWTVCIKEPDERVSREQKINGNCAVKQVCLRISIEVHYLGYDTQ